ncbi:MAG: DUF5681 domain-containing protein [Afipia sp.]|nr:DUF5681 domain-containing protein [Afipia sp.]
MAKIWKTCRVTLFRLWPCSIPPIASSQMTRDERGRYIGCGNFKGRPRKQARQISAQQNREDFFAATEMPVPIIENGKRKTIPAFVAINRQLVKHAVSGNMRAIVEYKKLERSLTSELWNEKTAQLEQFLKSEKLAKNFPEDVTDDILDTLKLMRMVLREDFPV